MKFVRRKEAAIIAGILVAFLALNLLTGSRSPTVWTDEVAYADPAINLVQHGEFTSTAWETQLSSEHWAGNVPLYPWLLAGWIQIFGVSITAVRSLNYVLIMLATVLLWLLARRTGWIDHPVARIAFVILVLSGYGITYAYRSGRPDMIGLVIISGGGLAATLHRPVHRYGALLVAGILLPIAGLQFLPYGALLCGLGLYWAPVRLTRLSMAVGSGALLGGGLLIGYYRYHGVWDDFLQSITRHTAAGQDLSAKLSEASTLLFVDPSYTLLLIGVLVVGALRMWNSQPQMEVLSAPAAYLLAAAVGTPLLLFAVGKYPTSYSWMGYVPLVFGSCVAASSVTWGRQGAIAVGALCLVACGIGLPARATVTILQWDGRSYAPVERVVSSHVRAQDTVFTTYQGYYAVKTEAEAVYLPKYLWYLSEAKRDELRAVDKMVARPEEKKFWGERLGGTWRQVALMKADERAITQFLGRTLAQPYRVAVYVRQSTANPK